MILKKTRQIAANSIKKNSNSELSQQFLDLLSKSDFKLTYSEIIIINSFDDLSKLYNEEINIVQNECLGLSGQFFNPILIQAISYLYFDKKYNQLYKSSNMGSLLKTTLNFLWNAKSNGSTSFSSLTKVMYSIFKALELDYHRLLYKGFAKYIGPGDLVLSPKGSIFSDNYWSIIQRVNKCWVIKGEHFRVLPTMSDIVYSNPVESLQGFEAILQGQDPKNITIFKNTFFSKVSPFNTKFWSGVYARFRLFTLCLSICCKISDPNELVLLGQKALFPKNLSKEVKTSTLELCWTNNWFNTLDFPLNLESNLIVDRPVVNYKNQFMTTALLIGDSLNNYIESAIMGYDEKLVPTLPSTLREEFISNKFEVEVKKIISDLGLLVGEVSNKGAWKNQESTLQLPPLSNGKYPGQIDALAYDEVSKKVYVIECKVLKMPATSSSMRNVIDKLGLKDDEKFHSKLLEKTNWIKDIDYFSGAEVQSLIVLDRWMPFIDYHFPVTHLSELSSIIEQ